MLVLQHHGRFLHLLLVLLLRLRGGLRVAQALQLVCSARKTRQERMVLALENHLAKAAPYHNQR